MTTDYASAEAFLVNLKTGRPVPRKKIANHTYVERGGHSTGRGDQIAVGEIGIVYHETAVVVYTRDGRVRLNTGGWLTTSTRDRINRFTHGELRLTSANARWIVIYARDPEGHYWSGPSVPFEDGMEFVDLSAGLGEVTFALATPAHDTSDEDRHNTMVKRLVRRYIKAIVDGSIVPTEHSCAMCLWTDEPTMTGPYCTTSSIPSVGDKMADPQHLIDHMLDGVLPASLLLHSQREKASDMERAERRLEFGINVTEHLRTFLLQRLLVGAVSLQHGRRPVRVGSAA